MLRLTWKLHITFTTPPTGHVHDLVETWIDYLIRLLQHLDQILGLLAVIGREECVRSAGLVRSPGSADAVNVVLGARRVVVVDDKLHIIHI